MISELIDVRTTLNIPQIDNSIGTSRSDDSSVRPKPDTGDPVCMAEETLDEFLGCRLISMIAYVVDLDSFII